MRARLSAILLTMSLPPLSLAAQENRSEDTSQILLLEQSFSSPTDSVVVTLKKGVMYWAQTDGRVTLNIRSARRRGWSALVVEVPTADSTVRRFEVHAGKTDLYSIRLAGLPKGNERTVRLFRDDIETKRFAEEHDRDFAIGLLFGGGGHTGYRLEASMSDPRGGRQFEGGIITQSGRFSALIGVCRESLHNPDFAVAWFFLEPRAQLTSGRLFSGRTDLALTLRLGTAPESGPHHLPPDLIAPGIALTQHLSNDSRRRSVSVYTAWRHGWIRNVPETEHRTTDEFSAGLSWIP